MAAENSPSRVWQFFNSTLGLWVLSSVLLAGLTTLYTDYKSYRTNEQERAKTEQRIVTELSNRMIQAVAGLRLDEQRVQHGQVYGQAQICNSVVLYLNNSFPENDFSVYDEYRHRKFRSLIVELTAAHPAQSTKLKPAVEAFEELSDLASEEMPEPPTKESSLRAISYARNLLETRLLGDYLKSSVIPELQDLQKKH